MWRHVLPVLERNARVVLMDLVGFGSSDRGAYDPLKYATLSGHADDVLEVVQEFGTARTVLVGHSVGAMVGLLAELASPATFAAHAMVAPTPCLRNDGGYRGGFDQDDLENLLTFVDLHFAQWAREMAALIAGDDPTGRIAPEFVESFCQAEPMAARQLARVTFTMDLRSKLGHMKKPTLILQSTDDGLAYVGVGEFVQSQVEGSELQLVNTTGHCPHITRPEACSDAILRLASRVACSVPG